MHFSTFILKTRCGKEKLLPYKFVLRLSKQAGPAAKTSFSSARSFTFSKSLSTHVLALNTLIRFGASIGVLNSISWAVILMYLLVYSNGIGITDPPIPFCGAIMYNIGMRFDSAKSKV